VKALINLRILKLRRNSAVAAQLTASQESFSSMKMMMIIIIVIKRPLIVPARVEFVC
jgi:hypothetical protein